MRFVGLLFISTLLLGCASDPEVDPKVRDFYAKHEVPTKEAVSRSAFGPRLVTLVAMLTGVVKASRRATREFVEGAHPVFPCRDDSYDIARIRS